MRLSLLGICFALLLPSPFGFAQTTLSADSVQDYSEGEQGKNGWSYMFYTSSRDGTGTYVPSDVAPMKWEAKPKEGKPIWEGPEGYFTLSQKIARPAVINGSFQGWPIRRWKSPAAGKIRIQCSVKCIAKEEDGIGMRIYVDGKEIYNKILAPQEAQEIDLSIEVNAGSLVDFAVTPGPGLNRTYDMADFHAKIQPAS